MKDGKIAFGIVGVGYIGHRHIAMIDADAETTCVAVADILPRENIDIRPELPLYSDLTTMLAAHPEIDVVSICTPNGLHAAMCIEALQAQKNVLVEKPLALSVADAVRIGQAEAKSKGRVFSVFQNRYTPTSEWIKQVVTDGTLGTIRQVNVNCMWNRDERYYKGGWHGTADMDGGTLFTQFSHYIDILLWLVGDIDILNATFADYAHSESTDFEDTGAVIFKTRKSDAIGTLTYTTAIPDQNFESSIILVGSRGTVEVGGQYMSDVKQCNISGYTMPTLAAPNPPNDYGAYKGSAANHCYVIRNVADVLLRGAKPTADYADGLRVVQTIENIYKFRTGDYYRH